MSRQLRGALRAGFSTLLASLLVSAALLTLPLALDPGFAHHHADGTPGHLHPFELFVGNSLPALPTAAPTLRLHVTSARYPTLEPWSSQAPGHAFESRAPPETVV